MAKPCECEGFLGSVGCTKLIGSLSDEMHFTKWNSRPLTMLNNCFFLLDEVLCVKKYIAAFRIEVYLRARSSKAQRLSIIQKV